MSRWTESRAANAAMGALILALLIIGRLTAGDFGLSWDEPDNAAFGRQALAAYASGRPPAEWQSNLESKGPFFVAVAEALSKGLSVIQDWSQVEARHFAYFLTLPLAAVALYSLGRRLVRPWAGFAAVLLFLTQPLIFGHAFINPKDTPFMAFFLLSMAIGVWMVEAIDASASARADLRRRVALPLAAGVSLGLATSIRLFAPFAGLLISILAIGRLRRRALGPLGLYWVAAGVATFLTWPYLWGNPWGRFWESLRVLVAFPWDNLVLYRGLVYPAQELPWHYLPFTTVIQLTEPALLLAIAGGVLGFLALIRDPGRRLFYLILFLWTAVPYGVVLLTRSEVYDNSRQFLFALPPLFLAAALAFEGIFLRLLRPVFQATVVALAVLPGVIGIAQLHPYEYVYYNTLVGGVAGAFREYELDYWATSYRQAMEGVNRVAAPGAAVEVAGPWLSAATFARPDLDVFKSGADRAEPAPPDYFLILTRSNMDQGSNVGGSPVLQVTVAGAVLAEVRAFEVGP